ncbi:Pc21g21200 [Talaromyces islandicus]|uniref:Pc21g21200 n=1 Tax=Talaromyces islandicus TaxID=28573 RepID=A0A0U1LNT5_TALIS|nr:Pc21g21200 [Talaromyces islandicus]
MASESEALFECVSPENEEEKAFMLVYMQIPYAGTELETSRERTKQASEYLSAASSAEFEALKILNRGGCLSCPKIINYKQEKQNGLGIVPGGYILYIALEKWPGIRLTRELFWELPRQERDSTREAFRDAFKSFAEHRVHNFQARTVNLRWCKEEKRIIVIKFQMSNIRTEKEEWREILWYRWGLAGRPKGWDVTATDGKKIDEKTWIL